MGSSNHFFTNLFNDYTRVFSLVSFLKGSSKSFSIVVFSLKLPNLNGTVWFVKNQIKIHPNEKEI